ncbi:MAG: hypothetical protein PWQ88_557 [Candidatus Methanomethylophilaceae archaeon]|nr:hypothetical protein [Candidatus Methanomethylophilaceae archaeon]MDI3541608.1 hypothetical protein [Candidatus Methanomethylophilaceae archaeon]HIJ00648.1 DUF749 family protein [Candidatus Methanomethylophilaceae archaeon]
MVHGVRLVGVFPADAIPVPYQGFVRHRAFVQGRDESEGDVAVLVIDGTTSFFAVFLDDLDLEEVGESLRKQNAELDDLTARSLTEASKRR